MRVEALGSVVAVPSNAPYLQTKLIFEYNPWNHVKRRWPRSPKAGLPPSRSRTLSLGSAEARLPCATTDNQTRRVLTQPLSLLKPRLPHGGQIQALLDWNLACPLNADPSSTLWDSTLAYGVKPRALLLGNPRLSHGVQIGALPFGKPRLPHGIEDAIRLGRGRGVRRRGGVSSSVAWDPLYDLPENAKKKQGRSK